VANWIVNAAEMILEPWIRSENQGKKLNLPIICHVHEKALH
jgi:hypothetical protein